MLSNHLNQDALDDNFAPSLPSSTNNAGKKASLKCANYTFHVAALVVLLGCRLGRSFHRPLCASSVNWSRKEKLYDLIQFQPLRFHCRDAVFTVRYDLNL